MDDPGQEGLPLLGRVFDVLGRRQHRADVPDDLPGRALTAALPRRRWHPLTIAAGLVAAALGVAVLAPPGWLLPSAWLVLCAAAGFATSGSV
ncbi:hypothetical protein EIY87_31650 [Amycolatopsis eburnea]|uniref:Uncharacterized protein n=1 Tax=Amycolatopsis eburnea TaxID=2267691 RepID=A0A3R9F448_9PSEU|nr:hypothetical protein EIY87_31650 [Amycolatopsis eburnea]